MRSFFLSCFMLGLACGPLGCGDETDPASTEASGSASASGGGGGPAGSASASTGIGGAAGSATASTGVGGQGGGQAKPPQAAYTVTFQDVGVECAIVTHNATLGSVTDSKKYTLVP